MSSKKKASVKELGNNLGKLIKYKTGIEKPPRRRKNTVLAIAGAVSAVTVGALGLFLNKKTKTDADASRSARFNISNPPTTSGAANSNVPPHETTPEVNKH